MQVSAPWFQDWSNQWLSSVDCAPGRLPRQQLLTVGTQFPSGVNRSGIWHASSDAICHRQAALGGQVRSRQAVPCQ